MEQAAVPVYRPVDDVAGCRLHVAAPQHQCRTELFIGILLGLAFHFTNSLFKYLGLLYDWPPLLAATITTMFVLALGAEMTWYQSALAAGTGDAAAFLKLRR